MYLTNNGFVQLVETLCGFLAVQLVLHTVPLSWVTCLCVLYILQEPKPESEIEIVTPLLEEQREEVVQQAQQTRVVQYVTSHSAACLHAGLYTSVSMYVKLPRCAIYAHCVSLVYILCTLLMCLLSWENVWQA